MNRYMIRAMGTMLTLSIQAYATDDYSLRHNIERMPYMRSLIVSICMGD